MNRFVTTRKVCQSVFYVYSKETNTYMSCCLIVHRFIFPELSPPEIHLDKGNECYNDDVMAFIMTSSNGNIFHVTVPLCGKSAAHLHVPHKGTVTRNFDDSFLLVWTNC